MDAAPWLRTTQVVSTRSPDPPNLPPGPAHRLADNYYCSRDLRRGVQPPAVVSTQKQLADTSEAVTRQEPISDCFKLKGNSHTRQLISVDCSFPFFLSLQ